MLVLFISMLCTSVWLTLVVLVFVGLMVLVTKQVGGRSTKFFLRQQVTLGDTNGYVEEMINGQKVIKVRCV